ncbi:MAG: hypothetical protein IAF02_20540 [Anaerolineae bacterium]|nr:hypothetical protein [Anaerolineae bacterium]
MNKQIFIALLVLWALAACSFAAEPDSESVVTMPEEATPPRQEVAAESSPTAVIPSPTTASSSPTAVPTNAPPAEPTAIPTSEPTAEPAPETAVIAGRTEEGAFFLGAVDAPVTMIDYSDFL